MTRIVFGALLLVHGLIHLAWFAPKPPDDAFPFRWDSPLLPEVPEQTMRKYLTPVIAVMVVTLALAALGVWGVPALAGLWTVAAITGAILSFVVMALLWHPWFVTGPVVNLLIIAIAGLGLVK
jgi:hypothetical protein